MEQCEETLVKGQSTDDHVYLATEPLEPAQNLVYTISTLATDQENIASVVSNTSAVYLSYTNPSSTQFADLYSGAQYVLQPAPQTRTDAISRISSIYGETDGVEQGSRSPMAIQLADCCIEQVSNSTKINTHVTPAPDASTVKLNDILSASDPDTIYALSGTLHEKRNQNVKKMDNRSESVS